MNFNNDNNSKPNDISIDLDSLEELILKSTKDIIEDYEYMLILKEEEKEPTKTYNVW